MYFIYCEKSINLNYRIEIKQFGLKFYSLTSNQRKYLKKEYENLYDKRFKIRNAMIDSNDGTIRFNYTKRKELEQDESLMCIIDMIRQNNVKPVFHKKFEEFLNHILVLEIEPIKLKKYIDCSDFRIFIHQFINFHYIFDSKTINKKKDNDISIPYQMKREYRKKDIPAFEEVSIELILKYLFNFYYQESPGCFFVNESFERYILNISKFINMTSSDELFKFIEILEIFFSNSRLSQNNILNDTLIIESILIKKESNSIEKDFVLKMGIIYKDSILKRYYSNEDLSVILHYLYNVRSTIIHGNMEKIFNVYNTFSQKIKSIPCPKFDKASKMQKKILIFKFTERLSYEFVKLVLIYWINHNDKINYIRNN